MRATTKIYVADFETTVTGDREQDQTQVWASALVQVDDGYSTDVDENVYIDNAIEPFFARLFTMAEYSNLVVYFHNLKFDGTFLLNYILTAGFDPALNEWDHKWREDKYMSKHSFKATISDKGQWYTIKVKLNNSHTITFKDSLKLLPFSVESIGKDFQTLHKKLEMEYVGDRQPYGIITDEEKKYIRNDVLVVKEALEIMFRDGLDKLTIGSCCKDQYKKSIMKCDADTWFKSMYEVKLDADTYGSDNADDYIRHSYKGGWCYNKKGTTNVVYNRGCTADVNSLYPSMMIQEGNDYPVGDPTFWTGNFIPKEAQRPSTCYFVRVRTRFYLKEGFLPTIQIKGNPFYVGNEWLETSDVLFRGKYYKQMTTADGKTLDTRVVLTLTQMDFETLKRHYDLVDFEILDGCWFYTMSGKLLFGEYVNKWAEQKKTSKGAKRQQAKLFLNNLYGKFSSKIDNSTKCPYLENGVLKYTLIPDSDPNKAWYIPIGSYITSYARNFTITAAQANYDTFIYADTDSIHCACEPSEITGITIHPKNFSCWALEATWDKAIFVRQKTYIEHVVEEDQEPIDKPYYNVKCAGMGKRCKQLIQIALNKDKTDKATADEKAFLDKGMKIEDFKIGLKVPSNLKAKSIKGGTLLVNNTYIMR